MAWEELGPVGDQRSFNFTPDIGVNYLIPKTYSQYTILRAPRAGGTGDSILYVNGESRSATPNVSYLTIQPEETPAVIRFEGREVFRASVSRLITPPKA